MKISWLLTLAGLVTSFAQQNDATDPQIAQQIGALILQYEEAFNEHDAQAATAFFTEDAVWNATLGHFLVAVRLSEGSQITIFISGISRTRSLLSIG